MRNFRSLRWFIFGVLLLSWCVFPVGSPTLAAQTDEATPAAEPNFPSFTLDPADKADGLYFAVTLEPGQEQTLQAMLGNRGFAEGDAVTYAADAYTIVNGGFGLKSIDDDRTGVTTWLDYPDERLVLAPGESVERTFTITVPKDVQPGQYLTGLAIETAEPLSTGADSGQFNLKQILRTITAVLITIPGPVEPSFVISDPAIDHIADVSALSATIENTGNVLISPAGTLSISDSDGNVIVTGPIQMGPVYAGDSTLLRIGLGGVLPEGDYDISIELQDAVSGIDASLLNETVAVSSPATDTAQPITVVSADAQPLPSLDKLQFLDISATIANSGESVDNARGVLHAFLNGTAIEGFPLASSLALPNGTTTIQGRYIPIDGWTSGEWTFTLSIELVDTGSSTARVIDTVSLGEPINIP